MYKPLICDVLNNPELANKTYLLPSELGHLIKHEYSFLGTVYPGFGVDVTRYPQYSVIIGGDACDNDLARKVNRSHRQKFEKRYERFRSGNPKINVSKLKVENNCKK